MGFLPKRLTLQNLNQVSVFVEDTNNEYFNVQEVPETITQGRYAFKIFGSDLLRDGVELKIELLDSEGNTIYLTPVDFIGEEVPPYVPYRYVTVEVYSPPINVAGLATLTILGEINPELVDVPLEFQNAYNVRYQQTINVDLSSTINTQPIRFFKNPTTEFQEIVQPKTVLSPVSESVVITTGQGIPRSDLKGTQIQIESGSLEKEALPHEVSDTFKDLRRFKDEYKYKTGLRGRVPAIISRRGLSRRFASLEEPKFKIKSDDAIFKSDMQGGTIEIPERTITLTKTDSNSGQVIEQVVTVPKFKTKILEVIDENTIVPEVPPTVPLPTGSQPVGTDIQEVTIEDFSNTPITASFNVTDTSPSQSSVHFDSMLDLTIKDMRTFSGDIYRVRVHGNSEAAGNDFTVLSDVIVESPELLVDSNSSSGTLRTGYFINQSHINTYWNTFSIDNGVKGTSVSATHTGSQFIDSMLISGSTSGFNESVVVETKPLKAFTLRKNIAYTLSAKVKGQTTNKVITPNGSMTRKGKLYFHLSGSNLNTSQIVTSHTNFGAELTDDATGEPVVLQLDEDINGIQNFETIEHTFRPRFNLDRITNTDTILQIRVESGEWFISDISLRPAMDTGFSPDEFNLKVPIPRSTRPDRFDFLVEYFDINNNVAETVTVIQDVPISGSALVIDGDGNLLTGSLFMGNAVNEGIEAAGVNSAFVRSVGYEGFESASLGGKGGFMIFSGSVLPNSPDNYEGAGIEIHDGTVGDDESYLKFRTKPSILDIHTSTFFLGKKHSSANFISGSNGNLEVSSSNFILTADGDVTMSGEITATGGTIGGFNIASTKITTTGIELGNSTEDLFISSSAFKVDHEGNITASNIDLGGTISATSGDVGGWTINAGSLTAGEGDSAVTMSSTDKIISMGSGSTFDKGSLQGGFRVGIDTDGEFKFAVGSAGSYLHADSSGVSIKSDSFDVTASIAELDVDVFKLSANNLFVSSSGGGFISAGNPRPTGIDGVNKGIFLRGDSPAALIGDANGSHIKFDGTTTSVSSSVFFLGSGAQFVSGSNGNIEISSSNFHLDSDGNVIMSGKVTANEGSIGGFDITDDALSSTNFFISGSSTGNNFFISSSNFNVKASGAVTASALQLSGGTAGGLTVSEGQIAVGEILKLKSSGQITGSKALLSGGKIAAWNISGNNISSVGGGIRLNGNGDNSEISVNSHTFASEGIQFGFNSGNPRFYAGDGAQNFLRYDTSNGVNIKTLKATISGSEVSLLTPKFFFGNASNFISGSDGNIEIFNTGTTTLSGSQVTIETPKFFMGGTQQFLSGSNGNLEISSSGFHLTPQGDVSASNILLGDKGLGDFLEFNSGVLTVQGEVFANSINTPATAPTPSASITSDGFAKFVSASIGGWGVTDSFIFKSISGSTAHQDITRVYLSATQDNAKNIGEGLQLYRKDEDVVDGGVKVVRVGGLSDTTNLHANNEYGIQVIKQNSASDYDNIMYIGPTTQSIASWNISTTGLTDTTGAVQFSSTEASMSLGTGQEILMRGNSNSPFISIQPAVALADKAYGEAGIFMGVPAGNPPLFSVVGGANSHIKFDGAVLDIKSEKAIISGSEITLAAPTFFLGSTSQFVSGSNGNIEISSSNFHLDSGGNVVMSGNVSATTGTIGGFTIGDDLSNSAGSTLKLKGSSGQITASAAQITGKVTATSGQIAGFTISGNTLTATNFTLDASGKSISLGTGTDIFVADGDVGIHLGHGTFGSAPFSVTKAGVLKSTSGTIGGWSIGSEEITGGSMIIRSDGTIESEGFASDVRGSGFRLTAASGGFLEVENARIRGTLSTAVFEKESVNAVGGQLYVANSTVLSGSLGGFTAASDTTMSVANVGGFVANEILSAKKVTSTGFATEYMLVQSASRDNPSSDTDFSGKLFVTRGYGSGTTGDSGSLGDTPAAAQTYTGSQVIVSTGKVGTGYIRLNANPNDTTTPYMDIVERTGSGVYDVDLKARLGDLSGLSSARLHGTNPSSAGFGLYSQNVFLEGGIVANTGSIGGINMESGKLYNGVGTHGNSNTGFYVDSGSKFSLGDKFVWDGSNLTVEGSITITAGPSAAQLSALNSATGSLASDISDAETLSQNLATGAEASSSAAETLSQNLATGAEASSSAAETLSQNLASGAETSASVAETNATNVAQNLADGSEASSSAVQTNLDVGLANVSSSVSGAFTSTSASLASTIGVVSSSTAERIMTDVSGSILEITPSPEGAGLYLNYPHMGFYDNSEFTAFISASGGFLFKADDDNLISFGQSVDGGDGTSTKSFVLRSDNVFLSGSKVNILGERFFLGGQSQFISGSNGNIEISSSNFHLDRDGNVDMSGKITSTEGSIGGFSITNTAISSSNNDLVLKSDGSVTGSNFLLKGGIITSDVTIQGSLSANSISTPTGSSPLAEITDAGFARFVSASIGGFLISTDKIRSANQNLVLNSNGQITASAAKIQGSITITGGATFDTINSINETTASLESSVSDLGDATSSFESSISSLGDATSSFESSISSLGDATSSFEGSITALGDATSSFEGSITALGEATSSLGNQITGAVDSGSAFASDAVLSGSEFASSAVESGSAFASSAVLSGSAFAASAVESGSLFASSAVQSGSEFSANAVASASLIGEGAAASSSAVQTNLDSGLALVSSSVSGAFNATSESIASRLITDSNGQLLDLPNSPSVPTGLTGALQLTYPHIGFYGRPTITDTTYVVTAAGGAYYIDGVQQATVELQVGYTYRFDTSAVGSHPFRFSTTSNGSHGGGSEYTTGVTVGSGYVDIEVTSDTPSTLYYYCTIHSNMGGQINVVDNSEYKAFISASGGFLFKADDNNLISFGQSVSGGDGSSTKSFVLRSDNVFLSGSNVNILGERFFLGGQSQFISGSNGNIEITSSNFHLDRDGNVDMLGKITSTEGSIGGFAITSTAISSSNDNLILKSSGQITASAVSMSGAVNATSGLIGGMKIESNKIESSADAGDGSTTTYTVTVNGSSKYEIDGVQQASLTFIPGNTYRFDQADDSNENHPLRFVQTSGGTDYYTTGVTINGTPGTAGAYTEIAVTQATPTQLYYRCSAHSGMGGSITVDMTSPLILDGNTGQITGSRVLFDGGTIGGSVITSGSLSSGTSGYENDGFFLDSGGRFSLGDKLSWDGTNLSVEGSITISSGDLAGITAATISGSTTIPEGTLSGSAQIADQISGSSNEFSSSAASSIAQTLVDSGSMASSVQLTSDGLNIVRADNGTELASYGATTTIGSTSGEHISISSDALEIKTSSTNTVLSASSAGLEMQGTVKASGGEIGGFAITSTAISSSNDNLILKSSGQITASAADLSGKVTATSGQIASWDITGDTLVSNNDDKIVLDAGNEKITISDTTFGNTGIQLEDNSGNPRVFIGKSGGSFLKFNSQTDILQISSSTFELGSKSSAFVSASSAGTLEISSSNFHVATNGNVSMSGNIKASGGQIATFTISSGSIDSNTSSSKRGLKLEPGDSIRGYGNTVHSTTTVQGKFSFGVASVAPPADAPIVWSGDITQAPGGGNITE